MLSVSLSIFTLSGALLLYGTYGEEWNATPFGDLLNQFYTPFIVIIITLGFIYYTFLISKPSNMISIEKTGIIKGVIFCLAFVFTLIMMITPLILY